MTNLKLLIILLPVKMKKIKPSVSWWCQTHRDDIIQLQTSQADFSVIQVHSVITTPLIKIGNKSLILWNKSGSIHCHLINTIRLYSLISIKSLNNLKTLSQSQGLGSMAWVATPRATLYQPLFLASMKKRAYYSASVIDSYMLHHS